jgi:hypothetical protein
VVAVVVVACHDNTIERMKEMKKDAIIVGDAIMIDERDITMHEAKFMSFLLCKMSIMTVGENQMTVGENVKESFLAGAPSDLNNIFVAIIIIHSH